MAGSDEVKALLERYEPVEWSYDGLGGKIIPWTKEHGGTSDDPSAQAFVLASDGTVLARAPDATAYQAKAFARWLQEQSDAFARRFPTTRMPFLPGTLERASDDDAVRCPELDTAKADERPALLYFGRREREGQEKAHQKEAKAARRFEGRALDSKAAADAAEGVVLLLRFDLGEEIAQAFAATFGVRSAPALVLLDPAAEGPETLSARLTGASLAYRLGRLAPRGD